MSLLLASALIEFEFLWSSFVLLDETCIFLDIIGALEAVESFSEEQEKIHKVLSTL